MTKKRSLIVIPVLLILTIATIGVGFAFFGDFNSLSNDTDARYTTITPQGVTTTDDLFSETIRYNTHVTITGLGRTVTYSLDPDQITEITIENVDHNVILLGEVLLRIEQTGGLDDYTFTINNTSGTMTGTFYTSLATSEDNTDYSAWVNHAYTIGSGTSYTHIDKDVEYLKLRLYVDSSFQSNDSALATQPLQNVTFMLKVTMEEA